MTDHVKTFTAQKIGRALSAVASGDNRILRVEREHHLENKVWGLALVQDRTGSIITDWTVEYEVEHEPEGKTWAKVTVLDGSPEDVEESGRYVHGEAQIVVHTEAVDYARKIAETALAIID